MRDKNEKREPQPNLFSLQGEAKRHEEETAIITSSSTSYSNPEKKTPDRQFSKFAVEVRKRHIILPRAVIQGNIKIVGRCG